MIFFDPIRCDIKPYLEGQAKFIAYSRYNLLIFFLKTWFQRPAEVCLPHLLWGRIIRFYAKLAQKISIIDDGLDTFREHPKNVDLAEFKEATSYYSFEYIFPLASWLQKFQIVSVCSIDKISLSTRPKVDLSQYGTIIIDSPGVQTIQMKQDQLEKTLLIKHSNPNKSAFKQKTEKSLSGNDFALEHSLDSFSGTLIVGESMTAIYALSRKSPSFKLIVCINEFNRENLQSLIAMVNAKGFATLHVA